MTTITATRRLAAILAADVVGYSRLMGADEEGTLNRLKARRREHHAMVRQVARVIGIGIETADMLVNEVLSRPNA